LDAEVPAVVVRAGEIYAATDRFKICSHIQQTKTHLNATNTREVSIGRLGASREPASNSQI
jgi:hypothetical protein